MLIMGGFFVEILMYQFSCAEMLMIVLPGVRAGGGRRREDVPLPAVGPDCAHEYGMGSRTLYALRPQGYARGEKGNDGGSRLGDFEMQRY